MIPGPLERVRIRFDADVARFIERRVIHATQRIERVEGGIELHMEVHGTTELASSRHFNTTLQMLIVAQRDVPVKAAELRGFKLKPRRGSKAAPTAGEEVPMATPTP